MNKGNYKRLVIALLMCLALLACGKTENAQSKSARTASAANERPIIVASNYPLFYFAGQIIGESVDGPQAEFPQISGDPANWVPSAEQIQLMQTADLLLLNGAGYESWLAWVTLDRDHQVDTSAGFSEQLIDLDESSTHQHGPEGEHAHQGVAFTTWLDPQLAIKQAAVVGEALTTLQPGLAVPFRANLSRLQSRLEDLDHDMAGTFTQLQDRAILFSHPVYQYLQRRYKLNGRSLHWEPNTEPATSEWISLQKTLDEHPANIILWESEPLASTTARLSEMGVRSIVFRTASNRSDQGDYFDIMADNIKQLRTAIN